MAVNALKSARDMVSAAYESRVAADARPKIQAALESLGEAQSALFALRENLFEIQTENQALRAQIAALNEWVAVAERYALTQTAGGAIVYVTTLAPAHYACPSCFGKKQLHILQDTRTIRGDYICTGCSSTFPVDRFHEVLPISVPDNPYV